MSQDFDYEKRYMGLPPVDEESGSFKVGSKYEFRLWALMGDIGRTKGKLLDVGCGAGGFIYNLKYHYPEFECYGCDISQSAIRFAREYCGKEIDFQVIKNGRLPYPDDFFDLAILIDVFEHVEDRDKLLKEIYRVLKKGGILHIQASCEANHLTIIRFCHNLTKKYWGHVNPLTSKEIISLVEKYKFRVVTKHYSNFLFAQIRLLVIYFLPKIVLDWLLGEKKSFRYTDVYLKTKKSTHFDILVFLRRVWFKLANLTSLVQYIEFIILRWFPLTALNIHLTCKK